jgi:hypothetical protein
MSFFTIRTHTHTNTQKHKKLVLQRRQVDKHACTRTRTNTRTHTHTQRDRERERERERKKERENSLQIPPLGHPGLRASWITIIASVKDKNAHAHTHTHTHTHPVLQRRLVDKHAARPEAARPQPKQLVQAPDDAAAHRRAHEHSSAHAQAELVQGGGREGGCGFRVLGFGALGQRHRMTA